MHTMTYSMTVRTNASMDEVEARVRSSLEEQGFGILTEIDVQATLREKLGVDRPRMKILGACNPKLADRAIQADREVTAFLPCNVTVSRDGDVTVVSAMKPTAVLELMESQGVAEVAREAERILWNALKNAVPEPLEEPVGAPA